MKNTTVSIKIDRHGLEVINSIISNAGTGYINTIKPTRVYGMLHQKRTEVNLMKLWRKVSDKLMTLTLVAPNKKRSFTIDINQWLTFTDMFLWYNPKNPYAFVVYSDIRDQIIKQTALQPSIFITPELAILK